MYATTLPADDLTRRRTLPPGAVWRDWRTADGACLRMAHWLPAGDRPAVLFLNGRADFIEKYAETYWRWRALGLGVMTFDWRGQGLSSRTAPASARHFETWLDDLAGIAAHARACFGGPLFLAGHSMGGHLALRHLARGDSGTFRHAAVFSPLVGIATGGLPPALLGVAARLLTALGAGDAYALSQGPYGDRQRRPQRQRLLTSDAARFADEAWWIDRNNALALGGATWRWIVDAFDSCRRLTAAGVPESIAIPVDVFVGSDERLVDPDAAAALAQRLLAGRMHRIEGGAHELLRERPALQDRLHAMLNARLGIAE